MIAPDTIPNLSRRVFLIVGDDSIPILRQSSLTVKHPPGVVTFIGYKEDAGSNPAEAQSITQSDISRYVATPIGARLCYFAMVVKRRQNRSNPLGCHHS